MATTLSAYMSNGLTPHCLPHVPLNTMAPNVVTFPFHSPFPAATPPLHPVFNTIFFTIPSRVCFINIADIIQ